LFIAKSLILFRTTSIPLASEAFNSRTPTLYPASPRRERARAWIEVVLPQPGGPVIIRLGRLPSTAMEARRDWRGWRGLERLDWFGLGANGILALRLERGGVIVVGIGGGYVFGLGYCIC